MGPKSLALLEIATDESSAELRGALYPFIHGAANAWGFRVHTLRIDAAAPPADLQRVLRETQPSHVLIDDEPPEELATILTESCPGAAVAVLGSQHTPGPLATASHDLSIAALAAWLDPARATTDGRLVDEFPPEPAVSTPLSASEPGERPPPSDPLAPLDLADSAAARAHRTALAKAVAQLLALIEDQPRKLLRGFRGVSVEPVATGRGWGEVRVRLLRGEEELRLNLLPRSAVSVAFQNTPHFALTLAPETPPKTLERERIIATFCRAAERYLATRLPQEEP